jgi:hypothetical protein
VSHNVYIIYSDTAGVAVSDKGSLQRFTAKVHYKGSLQRFTAKVHYKGSLHWCQSCDAEEAHDGADLFHILRYIMH